MGEHLPCKQGVRGSSPLISTMTGRAADAARIGIAKMKGEKSCASAEEDEGAGRKEGALARKAAKRFEFPHLHQRDEKDAGARPMGKTTR